MKAFVVHNPNHASFDEVPIPSLEDDQLLIKVKYCGICGTDFAIYSGNCSFVEKGLITYPIRIGHEWSGIVEKVGAKVTGFKKGDRVIGDNFISCGECEACHQHEYNDCTNKYNVGTIHAWDGAFADYVIFPQRHVYKVADHVSLKHAALGEPLSVAYGAIKKLDITPKSTIAVIGTGPIGLCAAALALYKGSKHVYLVGRNAYKLEAATKLGVTEAINTTQIDLHSEMERLTNGKGVDYVIECSGVLDNIKESIHIMTSKGKLMLVGFYEENLNEFDVDEAVSKEITITGIMGEFGNLEAVNQIMSEYDLKLDAIITSEISFDDCNDAFQNRHLYHNHCIKTIVYME